MNKKETKLDGNLLSHATFSGLTLKANESITAVFTIGKSGKVYVHLEFRDDKGGLLHKSRKKPWNFPGSIIILARG